MSCSYTSSTHDKTIFDELNIRANNTPLLLDLGFLGVDEDIIRPFKKPKNKELSITKKQLNKAILSLRVIIESAFSGIKRLKMLKDKIRIKCYPKRTMIVEIAAALHNLRLSQKGHLINS